MAKAKSAIPAGLHTVTPHLILDNAAQTIDWYKRALGATEHYKSAGPDGKIMHAELQIGDTRFVVNDAMGGGKGPQGYGGSPASFWLYVENSDALYQHMPAEDYATVIIACLTHDIGYVSYGVNVARRGWLEKEDVFNTKSAAQVAKSLV